MDQLALFHSAKHLAKELLYTVLDKSENDKDLSLLLDFMSGKLLIAISPAVSLAATVVALAVAAFIIAIAVLVTDY